jgi:hypothetical protein
MSPVHRDRKPSDFQVHGTAFIATKTRPTSRDASRQKTVRLPGIRHRDIATSRPTSGDSTWQHRKNGHFLNCGEQINGVRVVASHGVQGFEPWSDGGHVAMAATHSLSGKMVPMTGCRWTRGEWADRHGQGLRHGRPIMLTVREAIGMLSPPHIEPSPDLPFAARRTHHACGRTNAGNSRRCKTTQRQIIPAQPGLRTARLTDREMERETERSPPCHRAGRTARH